MKHWHLFTLIISGNWATAVCKKRYMLLSISPYIGNIQLVVNNKSQSLLVTVTKSQYLGLYAPTLLFIAKILIQSIFLENILGKNTEDFSK